MSNKTHFVCFKWGTLYPDFYVERLYKSVEKYFTHPFVFHCFSDGPLFDVPNGIHEHDVQFGKPFSGNWNKERIFAKDFLGLEPGTNIVVMDIDVLVTGNLNFLVEDNPNAKLLMAPDKYRTRIGKGHGSVYRLKSGSYPEIWDDLLAEDYEALKAELGGEREQRWLDRYFPLGAVELFDNSRIVSFKYDCKSRGWSPLGRLAAKWGVTTSWWGEAQLPNDARVVCFHGKPDIEDVASKRYNEWRRAGFINTHLLKLEDTDAF